MAIKNPKTGILLFSTFILFAMLSLHIPPSAGAEEPGDITSDIALSIGRSMEWPTQPGAPISVSNGAPIHVRDLGRRIRITAKKLGVSTVRVGNRVLNIAVVPEASYGLYLRLRTALNEMRGLTLGIDGKNFVIRGTLLRFEDWLTLARAAEGSNASYKFVARIEPDLLSKAKAYFNDQLRLAKLPDLALDLSSTPTVTLPVQPADLKDRVSRILSPFGFEIEQSLSSLGLEPLVRVKILVTELRKSASGKLGIDWSQPMSGRLLPSPRFPSGGTLDFNVQALERSGFGKVLASPSLLCRSGKEAQFLAGGEFPIKIANFKSNDVVWKRYGVLLKFHPLADESGRMSISIHTEVSMIDTSQSVDGIPGLLTNRIETHFDLNSGRTIALSGLIKDEWGKAKGGLAGLSQIPILGALFGSEEYRDNKTELVIFVTPEVVRPSEEGL